MQIGENAYKLIVFESRFSHQKRKKKNCSLESDIKASKKNKFDARIRFYNQAYNVLSSKLSTATYTTCESKEEDKSLQFRIIICADI